MRKLDWDSECGINVDGTNLTHLRFADGIVLIARSARKLEQMLIELDRKSSEEGLKMNPTKTKLMTNATKVPITVNGTQV